MGVSFRFSGNFQFQLKFNNNKSSNDDGGKDNKDDNNSDDQDDRQTDALSMYT